MNYKHKLIKFSENSGTNQVQYGTVIDESDRDYVISSGGKTMLFAKTDITIIEFLIDNTNHDNSNLILG
jgi:hypothetical protein